jgi:hypothetical protein
VVGAGFGEAGKECKARGNKTKEKEERRAAKTEEVRREEKKKRRWKVRLTHRSDATRQPLHPYTDVYIHLLTTGTGGGKQIISGFIFADPG